MVSAQAYEMIAIIASRPAQETGTETGERVGRRAAGGGRRGGWAREGGVGMGG